MATTSKKKTKRSKGDSIEFVPTDGPVSSGEFVKVEAGGPVVTGTLEPSTKLEEMPPVFRELAQPKLPQLATRDRARLQMQSPNRLFFYWSLGANPFQRLNKALGSKTASYTLVLKLVDLKRDVEQIHPVDAEGSFWFDVDADGEYRAEIGFYAPNRPYVRALYSNTVTTPRKNPSPRVDTESDWAVSTTRFARVLEVAGFTRDAFEVVIAGDDPESADGATRLAFAELVDDFDVDLATFAPDEMRHAMLLLASGLAIDALRWRISATLFATLQKYSERLSSEKALEVLKDKFEIEADEIVEEEYGSAVFGSSAINFPKRLKTRRTLPKLSPVSSAPSSPAR